MGRITKDAEVRVTSKDTTVSRFILAVDRRFAKEDAKQTADFISCVAFGKTAEFIGKYGLKGTKFIVEGATNSLSTEVVDELLLSEFLLLSANSTFSTAMSVV